MTGPEGQNVVDIEKGGDSCKPNLGVVEIIEGIVGLGYGTSGFPTVVPPQGGHKRIDPATGVVTTHGPVKFYKPR